MRAANLKTNEIPWKFRDHALFIGFGPVEAPQYVAAVVVEHGMHGASAAAPIARDILLTVQKRNPSKIHTVDDAVGDAAVKKPAAAVLRPPPRGAPKKKAG
jgi:penicillin-binding protein 2